ncbi:MAG: acyltransferase [Terracidiphilus sp.]
MGSFRTTLALSVVFAHIVSEHWLVGGRNAVQMFYCVSGFLITFVLTSGHSYTTKWHFYINRALRIYPIYYGVAAVSLIVNLFPGTTFREVFSVLPLFGRLVLGLVNLTVIGQDWVMFMALHSGKIQFASDFRASEIPLYSGLLITQAWTLGVELSFYILAPFIVTRIGRIWIALAISITVRFALAILGLGFKDPWTYRFFPSEMTWFMLGALSMRVLLPRWEKLLDNKPQWTASTVFSVLALLVVYPALPGPEDVKSIALIVLTAMLLPVMFLFQNQSAIDKQIGELSYPIYISHILVAGLSEAALAMFSMRRFGVVVAVQLVSVIAVAYCLNRFVAEPLERLRKRFRRPVTAFVG